MLNILKRISYLIKFTFLPKINITYTRFWERESNTPKIKILVLKIDGIGDYMLFRNFWEVIRDQYPKSKYWISFVCNAEVKSLALNYDYQYFDELIPIEKKIFNNYRLFLKTIININSIRAEIAIHPTYSRIPACDYLIKYSYAKTRIGSIGDFGNQSSKVKSITDIFYTQLVPASEQTLFEFERNKEFFQYLFSITCDQIKLTLENTEHKNAQSNPYIVVFPGASSPEKQWHPKNFVIVIEYLLAHTNFRIVTCGAMADKPNCKKILEMVNDSRISDLSATQSLVEFSNTLRNANLLLSNDTGAIHIAASANVTFVCVAKGNHLGRYNPYPKELHKKAIFVFPTEIESTNLMYEENKYENNIDINSISPDSVISKLIDEKLV